MTFDALAELRAAGSPVDQLPAAQQEVLRGLSPAEVATLSSIRLRVDAVSDDVESSAPQLERHEPSRTQWRKNGVRSGFSRENLPLFMFAGETRSRGSITSTLQERKFMDNQKAKLRRFRFISI